MDEYKRLREIARRAMLEKGLEPEFTQAALHSQNISIIQRLFEKMLCAISARFHGARSIMMIQWI